MSSIFARLPEHILKHAFEWGHEFAWPRADALAVIEWAEKQNYTVARAEVWVPSPEGPIIPHGTSIPGVLQGLSAALVAQRARSITCESSNGTPMMPVSLMLSPFST